MSNSILNKFYGENICLKEFEDILKDLEHEAVNVEIVKPIITAQYYDSFEWSESKDILSFDDESMEIPSISFMIKDIKEIINGIGIYTEHFLVKLKNKVEIMLWLNP